MQNLLKQLNQKPIAYYPIYRQITGSTTAGILLSQLMYWFSKKDKFYKIDSEIIEETFLTKKELENAKKLIKKLDFIIVSREGVPAKTFYEIDWEKYETCLPQLGNTDSTKGGNSTPPKGETIYRNTKNTTKNTTKIKNKQKEIACSSDASRIADYLFKKIKQNKPNFKPNNFNSWKKDIDLAMRIDKRSTAELKGCIDWIYTKQGSFWIPNILSGKKLREKFDTMESQMTTRGKASSDIDKIYATGLTATQVWEQLQKGEMLV